MTTTNPNPLDRIRSLAPADMTDDELGVAVRDEQHPDGVKMIPLAPDRWSLHVGAIWFANIFSDGRIAFPYVRNPALSYDALLPIVREWAYKNEATIEASTWDSDEAIEWHTFFHLSPDGALWCRADGNVRQLAEAFVTAAREVSQ